MEFVDKVIQLTLTPFHPRLLCYKQSLIHQREQSARGGRTTILTQHQDPPQNDTREQSYSGYR